MNPMKKSFPIFIKILRTCFCLFLLSCAKPNYVHQSDFKEDALSQTPCPFYFPSENLCLKFHWQKKPTETTMGEIQLRFFSPENVKEQRDPKGFPFVFLWMPSMGHGSSPTHTIRIKEGLYLVQDVFFIMPGPWDIHFQLKESEEIKEEKIYQVVI